MRKLKINTLAAMATILLASGIAAGPASASVISTGFETGDPLSDWFTGNFSSPAGSGWFQGNTGIFSAQGGSADSYLAANFLSAAGGVGTINNWLVTPVFDQLGNIALSFWARTADPGFSDRLQVLYNDTGSLNVADFNQVVLDINSTEAPDGFPMDWTLFSVNLQGNYGLGRFAFVYRSSDAQNADYIGLDTVNITTVPEPGTLALLSLGLISLALRRRWRAASL